jgi:flagellar basal-body rod protein FlgB
VVCLRAEQGRFADASQDGRKAEGPALLDLTMQAIQASLDGLAARQRITAANLANSETPGYTAQTISFEDSLASAISAEQPGGTEITTGYTSDPQNLSGNNVSVDEETLNAVDTGLRYQLATQSMNAKFKLLSSSIRFGG